jgi:branched-chain amino acid transport system permease protein
MSIGLTLTYMTTKVPNFAHGSLVTVGAYTAFTLYVFEHLSPYASIPFSFLAGGLGALAIYLGVLGPLARRGASIVALMIATLAIDIAFIGIIGAYADYLANTYLLFQARSFALIYTDFHFMGIQGLLLVLPGFVVATTVALYLFLTRTRFGRAMRASIENPNLASILGINTGLVFKISWFLAGGLAGLAGSFYVLWLQGTPGLGSDIIIAIFASSIVGGLTNIYGAIIGGLLVGGSEVLISTIVAQGFGPWNGVGSWFLTYQTGIPLLVMIAALLIFPQGIGALPWSKILRRK